MQLGMGVEKSGWSSCQRGLSHSYGSASATRICLFHHSQNMPPRYLFIFWPQGDGTTSRFLSANRVRVGEA